MPVGLFLIFDLLSLCKFDLLLENESRRFPPVLPWGPKRAIASVTPVTVLLYDGHDIHRTLKASHRARPRMAKPHGAVLPRHRDGMALQTEGAKTRTMATCHACRWDDENDENSEVNKDQRRTGISVNAAKQHPWAISPPPLAAAARNLYRRFALPTTFWTLRPQRTPVGPRPRRRDIELYRRSVVVQRWTRAGVISLEPAMRGPRMMWCAGAARVAVVPPRPVAEVRSLRDARRLGALRHSATLRGPSLKCAIERARLRALLPWSPRCLRRKDSRGSGVGRVVCTASPLRRHRWRVKLWRSGFGRVWCDEKDRSEGQE
ncbi:hypothetical protein B0H13DRAFT_1855086 [Mycena leptocephala]|nr:hypothetical protein B0H13DRAFT_1855086 [Mycena leptocephala]